MNVRQELGQVRWLARQYKAPQSWRRQLAAIRGIKLPPIPRQRTVPGRVWGVTMVKDELDVLPDVLDQLLEQGLERLLVADNLSTDGTREYLEDRGKRDSRILVAYDNEPAYFQAEKMTWLARQAWRAGAEWVVPFDADEFWFARDMSVAEYLDRQSVGIVHAAFHHMVPTVPAPEPLRDAEFILDSTPAWPGKVAVRTHPLLFIVRGNHNAVRIGGSADGLFIAHAQYRSPVQVARKVRQGTAAARLTGGDVSVLTPHWAVAESLADDAVREVWDNISHGRPDARLGYEANGPMVQVAPLRWRTWDPQHELGNRS